LQRCRWLVHPLVSVNILFSDHWNTLGFFLLSTILTALLQFFTSYTMAMLAVLGARVSTFIYILFAFEYIASGICFLWTSCRTASNARFF